MRLCVACARVFASESPADGWLQVTFDYNAAVVEDIKAAIPPALRQWNKESKVWLVHPDARDLIVAFAAAKGFEVRE